MVHGYGLAASQLMRLKDAGITLTISVDKVAASGGYMMACVGDEIIAAPFAILGSIGVVAQLPNFHRLLKKNDIDFEMHTAGEYKRLSRYSVKTRTRPERNFRLILMTSTCSSKTLSRATDRLSTIDEVGTGEFWFGQRALEKIWRIACVPPTAS